MWQNVEKEELRKQQHLKSKTGVWDLLTFISEDTATSTYLFLFQKCDNNIKKCKKAENKKYS